MTRRPAPAFSRRIICLLVTIATVIGIVGITAPAAVAARIDKNAVLRVGVPFFSSTSFNMDPRISITSNEATWYWALYAPLMRYSQSTGKYTPYLAESVTVVDPSNVKVVIRNDAMFDNNQPVTSADAKATLEAMVANQKAGRANGINAAVQLISSVEVVDTKTFIIHFSRPALGVVYELLANREGIIVPASAGASQNTAPVGNGPFKFTSLTAGVKLVTERSSTFFGAKTVQLKGVEFLNLLGGTPQMNALLAGDIDLTASASGGGLDATTYEALRSNNKFRAMAFSTGQYTYIDMCRSQGYLFSDVRVRQALQLGIDREALAQALYGDKSLAATQLWQKGELYYDASIAKENAYNPKKAKKLLADAGVAPGTSVTFLINPPSDPSQNDAALRIKQQLEKIGLSLNISQTDNQITDFYVPASAKPPTVKYQATMLPYTRVASAKLTTLFTPNTQRNACNFLDDQITTPMNELQGLAPTSQQAITMWKKVDKYVMNIAAVVPLVWRPNFIGASARINGLTPDRLGPVGQAGYQYDKFSMNAGKS